MYVRGYRNPSKFLKTPKASENMEQRRLQSRPERKHREQVENLRNRCHRLLFIFPIIAGSFPLASSEVVERRTQTRKRCGGEGVDAEALGG